MKIRKDGKVINLTETDLRRIVKRVIKEDMSSSEYSEDIFDDEDEYYGTFDDKHKVNRRSNTGDFDYEDYDEDEFEDFDSYRKSKYRKDRKNRWDFNDPDDEMGRKFFKTYQEKSGGKPFKVRRRR